MGAAAPIRAAQSQHAATAKRMCHRVLRSEAVHGAATKTKRIAADCSGPLRS